MDEQRLPRGIHRGEAAAAPDAGRRSPSSLTGCASPRRIGEGAAQGGVVRIAERHDGVHPVDRAALDDEHEARVASARRRRRGAGPARRAGSARRGRERCGGEDHGVPTSAGNRARRAAARAPAARFRRARPRGRGGRRHEPGSSLRPERRARSVAGTAAAMPLRHLDPAEQRVGRRPARGDVVPAGGRARPPHRLAELRSARRPARASAVRAPTPRSAETVHSHGVLNLASGVAHASGASISAR